MKNRKTLRILAGIFSALTFVACAFSIALLLFGLGIDFKPVENSAIYWPNLGESPTFLGFGIISTLLLGLFSLLFAICSFLAAAMDTKTAKPITILFFISVATALMVPAFTFGYTFLVQKAAFESLINGPYLFVRIINPALGLLTFLFFAKDHRLGFGYSLLGFLPTLIYAGTYILLNKFGIKPFSNDFYGIFAEGPLLIGGEGGFPLLSVIVPGAALILSIVVWAFSLIGSMKKEKKAVKEVKPVAEKGIEPIIIVAKEEAKAKAEKEEKAEELEEKKPDDTPIVEETKDEEKEPEEKVQEQVEEKKEAPKKEAKKPAAKKEEKTPAKKAEDKKEEPKEPKKEAKPAKKVEEKAEKPAEKKAAKPAAKKTDDEPNNLYNGKARVYHISRASDGIRWQVKLQTGEKAIKIFRTQAEAIAYADQLIATNGGSKRVHSMKGSIRKA